MGHIFISYSHKDTKYAHGLSDELKAMGFDVWIDERLDYGLPVTVAISRIGNDKVSAWLMLRQVSVWTAMVKARYIPSSVTAAIIKTGDDRYKLINRKLHQRLSLPPLMLIVAPVVKLAMVLINASASSPPATPKC